VHNVVSYLQFQPRVETANTTQQHVGQIGGIRGRSTEAAVSNYFQNR